MQSKIKALTQTHNKDSTKALSIPNTSIKSSIKYSTTHRIQNTVTTEQISIYTALTR
jgi:hypothetical protein